MSTASQNNDQPTGVGVVTFFVIAIGALFLAEVAANRIYLIHHYGWQRFVAESLTFTKTPKGSAWVVSNGDKLAVGFGHFLIGGAIWLILFGLVFGLALKIVGKKRLFRDEQRRSDRRL